MSGRALHTSRYSPGNLAPHVLERLFVGRSELLDDLIAKVSRSILSKDKQHLLLVGPRGTGKTHFIALLHQRLTTDPGLAAARAKSVIAYLNEEEWGVASFLDFILAILRSIRSDHEEIAGRITLVEETFGRDPDKARDLAEDTLVQVVKDKTLVLLCENLHDLFEGIGAEGQARWRSLVQQHPFWCIVATVPALFFAISRQTEPFYGFFTIRSLEKLSVEDAIELLRRKAELEGRHDLAEALDTPIGRARVRAIHHIAGGNHRAYIVLSEFLTKESLDELVSPFMNMVDDLTPYYQERMRNLTSPLQRKLVDYLCRQRTPTTVKDIAKATLVQPQSAAKQLGELTKAGIVQKASRGRESFYELSEPLMRICIEVKDNRTAYVKLFVDLLRHWFSSKDLESRHRDIEFQPGSLDHLHLWAALEDYKANKTDPFLDALRLEVRRCKEEGDLRGIVEAAGRRADELGQASDYLDVIGASLELEDYASTEKRALDATVRYPDNPLFREVLATSLFVQDKFEAAIEQCDKIINTDPQRVIAWQVRGNALYGLGRYEEAIVNQQELLRIAPDQLLAYEVLVRAFRWLGRTKEAFEASSKLINTLTDSADLWLRHLVLSLENVDLRNAEEAIRQIQRLSNNIYQQVGPIRVFLKAMLGDWRGAVVLSEEIRDLQKTPDAVFAHAWAVLGAGGELSQQQESALMETTNASSKEWLLMMVRMLRARKCYRLRDALVSQASTRMNEHSNLLYEQALAFADQGKIKGVIAAAERESAVGITALSRPLMLLAQVARQGLSSILGELPRSSGKKDDQATHEILDTGLWIELLQRGPSGFAAGLLAVREWLVGPEREEILAEILLAILRRLLGTQTTLPGALVWTDALVMLSSRLTELEIPLQLFSVGVRYAATQDEGVLLELPLEQRKLLTDEIGKAA